MATNQEMLSQTYVNVHKIHTEQIPALPVNVWAVKVRRDGKEIGAIQELADTKTLGLENKAALAEVHKKLDAILAKLNEGA